MNYSSPTSPDRLPWLADWTETHTSGGKHKGGRGFIHHSPELSWETEIKSVNFSAERETYTTPTTMKQNSASLQTLTNVGNANRVNATRFSLSYALMRIGMRRDRSDSVFSRNHSRTSTASEEISHSSLNSSDSKFSNASDTFNICRGEGMTGIADVEASLPSSPRTYFNTGHRSSRANAGFTNSVCSCRCGQALPLDSETESNSSIPPLEGHVGEESDRDLEDFQAPDINDQAGDKWPLHYSFQPNGLQDGATCSLSPPQEVDPLTSTSRDESDNDFSSSRIQERTASRVSQVAAHGKSSEDEAHAAGYQPKTLTEVESLEDRDRRMENRDEKKWALPSSISSSAGGYRKEGGEDVSALPSATLSPKSAWARICRSVLGCRLSRNRDEESSQAPSITANTVSGGSLNDEVIGPGLSVALGGTLTRAPSSLDMSLSQVKEAVAPNVEQLVETDNLSADETGASYQRLSSAPFVTHSSISGGLDQLQEIAPNRRRFSFKRRKFGRALLRIRRRRHRFEEISMYEPVLNADGISASGSAQVDGQILSGAQIGAGSCIERSSSVDENPTASITDLPVEPDHHRNGETNEDINRNSSSHVSVERRIGFEGEDGSPLREVSITLKISVEAPRGARIEILPAPDEQA